MGFVLGFIGAMTALLLVTFWYGSTRRRREVEVFAFIERIGLPMTDHVYSRVDRRLRARSKGATAGGLISLFAFAVLFGITLDYWPIGVAGASTTGILTAALALGGAVSALGQFTAPQPGAPRFARAQSPSLGDYVHPGWVLGAAVLAVVSAALSIALFIGLRPTTLQGGLPLGAVLALAVLALTGIVAVAALSSMLLAVPQPASSELELQWDDALRAYALRDLWIASIALSTAAFVAGFSWLFDYSSPFVFVGLVVGLSPLWLVNLPVSRRPIGRLWEPSATTDPSRC
ncbi:hypothetical protein C3B60_03100 [Cryobacterium zongtaii]|nr:hypothetical protein C3B60_03100 [Cryobacterium zongtaii]